MLPCDWRSEPAHWPRVRSRHPTGNESTEHDDRVEANMTLALPQPKPTSVLLPGAAAALAAGIFVADTLTEVQIAVAVLYVAVVLMASRFCRPRGVILMATGCAGLTVLSYFLSS